jgi:hypothetical protein
MGGMHNGIADPQHRSMDGIPFETLWDDIKYAEEVVGRKALRAVRPHATTDLAYVGAVSENLDLMWVIRGAEPDNTFNVDYALHYEFVGDDSKLDEVGGATSTACDVTGFAAASSVAIAAAPHISSGKMGWKDVLDGAAHLLRTETHVTARPYTSFRQPEAKAGKSKTAKSGRGLSARDDGPDGQSWSVAKSSRGGEVDLPWSRSRGSTLSHVGRFFAQNADVLVPALVNLLS